RRRHTRFSRDWSSDVCSSDLVTGKVLWSQIRRHARRIDLWIIRGVILLWYVWQLQPGQGPDQLFWHLAIFGTGLGMFMAGWLAEIGRASCRERVRDCVGRGGL